MFRFTSALLHLVSEVEVRHSATRRNWIVFESHLSRMMDAHVINSSKTSLSFLASPPIHSHHPRVLPPGNHFPINSSNGNNNNNNSNTNSNSNTSLSQSSTHTMEDGGPSSPLPHHRPQSLKLYSSPQLTSVGIAAFHQNGNLQHEIAELSNNGTDSNGRSYSQNHHGDYSSHPKAMVHESPSERAARRPPSVLINNMSTNNNLLSAFNLSSKENHVDSSEKSRRLSSDFGISLHNNGSSRLSLSAPPREYPSKESIVQNSFLQEKSINYFPKLSKRLLELLSDEQLEEDDSELGQQSQSIEDGWISVGRRILGLKVPVAMADAINENRTGTNHYHSDFVSYLTTLLSDTAIPISHQEDSVNALMKFSRKIAPNNKISLPIQLVSLKPRRYKGCEGSPSSLLQCPAVIAARENYFKRMSKSSSSDFVEPISENGMKSSALFFDPFAKKRAKQKKDNEVKSTEVLWPIGGDYFLTAVFNNPFSVPFKISNIQPIFDCTSCKSVCRLYIFPTSITIPAQVDNFEVDLRVQVNPISGSILFADSILKVLGVNVRMNNAECSILVGKDGLSDSNK